MGSFRQFGSKPSFGKAAVENVEMGTMTKWMKVQVETTPTESLPIGLPKYHCRQSSNAMHTKCSRGLSNAERMGNERRPCAKSLFNAPPRG